ncbi:MAG: phosphoribosyltransferase family protein [Campylobacterota bacterium]|nr:phosphoribosyltransferase family protein [Campylobacterota bacterium]
MGNKQYYSYNECLRDCKNLLPKIETYNPDTIVAIARGGLTFGHLLSQGLDKRELYTINSIHYDDDKKLDDFKISNIPNLNNSKKVLIVDDIIDSGETMVEIINILNNIYPNCEYKIASLFYKKNALIQPDFTINEAINWIEFFWEVDI